MRFGFKLPHQGTTWSAVADVSAQVSYHPAGASATAETVTAWGAAGAAYVIVMLPAGAGPDVLVDLATAVEPLWSPPSPAAPGRRTRAGA